MSENYFEVCERIRQFFTSAQRDNSLIEVFQGSSLEFFGRVKSATLFNVSIEIWRSGGEVREFTLCGAEFSLSHNPVTSAATWGLFTHEQHQWKFRLLPASIFTSFAESYSKNFARLIP